MKIERPGGNSGEQPKGLSRVWALLKRPTARWSLGTILVVGFASGIVFWGGFNWALEITNTESFCISCHEMEKNVYAEYKGTIHDANRSGVRATCPDCHVPKDWAHKIKRKVQASNEVLHKVLGSIDTPEKFEAKRLVMAGRVWDNMKQTDSRECRNCHEFASFDLTRQAKRARDRHAEATEQGKTCIDCHKGIAHGLPEGVYDAERRMNERFK